MRFRQAGSRSSPQRSSDSLRIWVRAYKRLKRLVVPPGFEPGPTPFQPIPPGAKRLTFQGFGRAVVQAISVRLADMFARCLHGRAGRTARSGACYDDGVRLVEAHYENGVLRPVERLGLRSGECVSLMVVRRPDPRRWDLAVEHFEARRPYSF